MAIDNKTTRVVECRSRLVTDLLNIYLVNV